MFQRPFRFVPSIRIPDPTDNPTGSAANGARGGRHARRRTSIRRTTGRPRLGGLESLEPRTLLAFQPLHGLDFSPYIAGEDPRGGDGQISNEVLLARMTAFAPYTNSFRSFACNEDLKEVGQYAHQLGKTSVVNAWIGPDLAENQRQIDCLVDQAAKGHVDMAVVGSESLLRGDVTSQQLIGYLQNVKSRLTALNVTIPVTTADVYSSFLIHPEVISSVDVVFANIYPFWEGAPVDAAIYQLRSAYEKLSQASGQKKVVISETGWPSAGEAVGSAVPSPTNAAFYFANFLSWAESAQVEYYYFEAGDEPWKIGEGKRGASWGLFQSPTTVLKPGMQEVFDGLRIEDNWTNPPAGPPVIDFATSNTTVETNLGNYLVVGQAAANSQVTVNGQLLAAKYRPDGNYAYPIALSVGENSVQVDIKAADGTTKSVTRTIVYNPQLPSDEIQLVYVAVASTAFSGTVVLDMDHLVLFGTIPGKQILGATPANGRLFMDDGSELSIFSHSVVGKLPVTTRIAGNSFAVTPDGNRVVVGNQLFDVATNSLEARLPASVTTGTSWASADIPGGPAISPDGTTVCGGNRITCIDLNAKTATDTGITGGFISDLAISPDGKLLMVSDYGSGTGRLRAFDWKTRALVYTSVFGDFAGEIAFPDANTVVVGNSGNPSTGGGVISVFDLKTGVFIQSRSVSMADNVAAATANRSVFVASGSVGGVDVYVYGTDGSLHPAETFYLGANKFVPGGSRPERNEVKRIVYKPASPPLVHGDLDRDSDVDSADLALFLANWTGAVDAHTGGKTLLDGDFDDDADVDSADLLELIARWTSAQAPPQLSSLLGVDRSADVAGTAQTATSAVEHAASCRADLAKNLPSSVAGVAGVDPHDVRLSSLPAAKNRHASKHRHWK
ncbi:MAG: glycosyl hydrolase family 17 protein [Pirellulales bacterium]